MTLSSFEHGTNHIDPVDNPDNCNCNVQRPFEFCILLTRSITQRKCNCTQYDDQLPPPKMDFTQQIAVHTGFQYPLKNIIRSCKYRITHKCKNYSIGMD